MNTSWAISPKVFLIRFRVVGTEAYVQALADSVVKVQPEPFELGTIVPIRNDSLVILIGEGGPVVG